MKFAIRQKWKKVTGYLLACSLAGLLIPSPVLGQEIALPRAQLSLEQQLDVASGVRHLTYKGILADGQPVAIQVIEADLKNPEVEVRPVGAQVGNYGKRESVGSMGARTGGIAAINGGFYSTSAPYEPVGNLILDGEAETSSEMFRVSLGWLEGGAVRFGYFNPQRYVEQEPYWQGLKHLLTAGPLLVEEGRPIFQYGLEGYSGSLEARHPRTAVGVTKEGKMLLVTVDGRQPGKSVGLTFDELAFLMADLGAEMAMGLDGGGSTTAWVNGKVVNQLSEGSQRLVANALVVRSGIAVFIDGKRIYFDVPPRVEQGRTLVPLRAFFEGLGAVVDWQEKTQTVVVQKGETEVRLAVGSSTAIVNGVEVPLDVPAKVENGRTLVPLRFVGEALGAEVLWDPAKIITINSL